ncbi:hypothetical protein DL766_007702 [Monosporascus sp. MC13-8B]|nr:hypothetical protein DL763_010770 [Monosporascus cannonballus]RYP22601.1 hypothetical protein DL766_007702 [Monosporascus sp. MC13-8B]
MPPDLQVIPGNPTSWLQNLGIAIEIICPTLALLVTLLRTIADAEHCVDDVFICLAMVLSIALAVGSIIVMKKMFIGIRYWDVPPVFDITPGLMWIYTVGAVYNPILALVKQSVLIFLLRFAGVKSLIRNVVWTTTIFNAALMVAVFFVVLFQCIPVEMNWNPLVQGHCIQQFKFGVSTACLTILTDLIAVALPFYIVLGLNMNRRRKIGLIGVFMLGILVTVVSVVRLYFFAENFTSTEPDKNFSLGFCVSAIECNLAIMTACGPALWPLVRRWMPRHGASTDPSYGAHKYGGSAAHRQQGWIKTNDEPSNADSAYALKDLNSDKVHTHVRSSARDSDEEILTGTGIMRTTHFTVTTDDPESRRASHQSPEAFESSKVSRNDSL